MNLQKAATDQQVKVGALHIAELQANPTQSICSGLQHSRAYSGGSVVQD
jgi:hypothetical protein